MGVREEVQKRIEKKRTEIAALESQVRDAEIYIQALEDTLKILPKDLSGEQVTEIESELRPGSRVAKAREFLRTVGRPSQVMDILKGIGEEPTNANRAGLSGSISAYVRENRVFTRPAPNTFGLIEFGSNRARREPPPGFGVDSEAGSDEGDPPLPWEEDEVATSA
jgi:hypothetical protein